MPSEAATVASLGRSCKAKAKAKAKERWQYRAFIAEVAEQVLANEAAEERRAAFFEAQVRQARHDAAASEPCPWADMEGVDDIAESVVHADNRGVVSILVPAGSGVPCTECQTQHRGVCSFHNLLLADISTLKLYAEAFVPPGPEFH